MSSWLNNPLTYLFTKLEEESGVIFANFNVNETSKNNPNIVEGSQMFMKHHETNNENKLYKYLYDPNLSFDFRFHQRIANMKYIDKGQPWVTLMYNTGEVRPLTNVLSHTYTSQVYIDDTVYEIKTKRMSVPINFVLVSNDPDYLYSTIEGMSSYFDRIVNFPYKQAIKFSDTYVENFDRTGMATNINPVDLTKLDTEMRGTLFTTAYNFNLVYYTHTLPEEGKILKEIDIIIKVKGSLQDIELIIK